MVARLSLHLLLLTWGCYLIMHDFILRQGVSKEEDT